MTAHKIFSEYHNATVLITGGAGFMGSALAKALVEYGAKVIIIDNMHPYGGGNLYNIQSISDKITFYEEDIQQGVEKSKSLLSAVSNSQYLFHLAALTGHMDSMNNPVMDLKQNTESTLHLLELCCKYNPKIRTVYTSTRQLYGTPSYLPVDENHPIHPLDINGIHKLTNEHYFNLYYKYHGLPTTILRITNAYGPGLRIKDSRQMFLGVWLRNVLEEKPFEIWGGEQVRDLVYIDDVRDAILMSALSNDTLGETYNVGGLEPVNLIELANIFSESVKCKVEYHIKPYPEVRKPIEIGNIYLDSQKLKEAIGWSANIDLKTGLARTMEYYQQHFKGYL